MTEKTKQAFILVGPSGCGKSTFVKERFGACVNPTVFSLDTVRLNFLDEDNLTFKDDVTRYTAAFNKSLKDPKGFDARVTRDWKHAVTNFDTVFVDNTNLTRKARMKWVQDLRKHGFQIIMVEFMVPLQTVLDRQSTRGDKSVPLEAVKQHYMRQESIHLGVECDGWIIA